MSTTRARRLAGLAAASAGGFALVARATATRASARADRAVLRRTGVGKRHPAARLVNAVHGLGKWWGYLPLAAGMAAYVVLVELPGRERARRRRRAGAGAILLAGAVAAGLEPHLDDWLPQPPTPPGHANRRKPTFPSGHAMGATAVATTAALVLSRERLASPAAAGALATVLPTIAVSGRVLARRHWATDVLGGWLAARASPRPRWLSPSSPTDPAEGLRADGGVRRDALPHRTL